MSDFHNREKHDEWQDGFLAGAGAWGEGYEAGRKWAEERRNARPYWDREPIVPVNPYDLEDD